MKKEKARELEYIVKVFSKLPTEKQENLLKNARSLLAIQEKEVRSIKIERGKK